MNVLPAPRRLCRRESDSAGVVEHKESFWTSRAATALETSPVGQFLLGHLHHFSNVVMSVFLSVSFFVNIYPLQCDSATRKDEQM